MKYEDVFVLVDPSGIIVGASVADERPTEVSFLGSPPPGHDIQRVKGPVILSRPVSDYERSGPARTVAAVDPVVGITTD